MGKWYQLPLVGVVVAALSVSASADAVARSVPAAGVQASAIAAGAPKRPAALSGRYRPVAAGLQVKVTCDCRRVRLTYRLDGRPRARILRTRAGVGRIVLPAEARRIRAHSPGTRTRKAGHITLRGKRPHPSTQTPGAGPGATPSRPGPTPHPTPRTTPPPTPVPSSDPARVFRIVVVPDTQIETKARPDLFTGRMRWIADKARDLRLRHVIQVGDLVDTDNCGIGSYVLVAGDPARPQCDPAMRADKVFYPLPSRASHYQYTNASTGLRILEDAEVPYTLTVGNHDTAAVCGGPACVGRNPDWAVPAGTTTYDLLRTTTTWDATFPPSRFPAATTFEPDTTANLYRTFSAGGLDWMIVSLELWPRPEVVRWAAQMIQEHPHHNVIITTHHYLNSDGSVSATQDGYGSTTPQYLWDNLVKKYPNIRFVFSGHVGRPADRVDVGEHGNPVRSIVTCYHDASNAQTMVVTIDPTADSASATTYLNPGSQTTVPGTDISMTDMQWVQP